MTFLVAVFPLELGKDFLFITVPRSVNAMVGVWNCVLKFVKVLMPLVRGAVGICEMLFYTSLVAFVGSGEQPELSPRRLLLLNTSTQKGTR